MFNSKSMFIEKQHHPHCWSSDIPVIDFLFFFPRLLVLYYGLCVCNAPSATTDILCLSAFCLPLFSVIPWTLSVFSVVALKHRFVGRMHRPQRIITLYPWKQVWNNATAVFNTFKAYTVHSHTPSRNLAVHTLELLKKFVMIRRIWELTVPSRGYFGT